MKARKNMSTHIHILLYALMSLYMEAFHQGDLLMGGKLKCSLKYGKHIHTWLRRELWEKLAQRRESFMDSKERSTIF